MGCTGMKAASNAEQIRILCASLGITQSALAEKLGTTRQNLNRHISRNTFTIDELKQLAESVNCKFVTAIILPNGEMIEY